MSLSKRARRDISIFSRIQWDSPKRGIYLLSQKRMINLTPPADPKLVQAASEAMEILTTNGEKANADIQAVRGQDDDAKPNDPETGTPNDVQV